MFILFNFSPVVLERLINLFGLVVDTVSFQFVLPHVVLVHLDALPDLVICECLHLLEDYSLICHLKIF